jgi:phospholipase/carboxylesterase
MLKFPGATGAIMQGLRACPQGGSDWYQTARDREETLRGLRAAGAELAHRIASLQQDHGLDGSSTILVGFAQGATLALEVARRYGERVAIVVASSGRMMPLLAGDETLRPTIHLIHGLLDTVTPVAHAQQAYGRLKASGASVTLDLIEDLGHSISQDVIIVGTTRALQTIFRGRGIKMQRNIRAADSSGLSMTATVQHQGAQQ